MYYDELMDLFITARHFNESTSQGEVRAHMELIQSVYNDLRTVSYRKKWTEN